MSLPSTKVHTLQETIHVVLQATKVTIQQLESLLRLLNFSCWVVAHGRAFYRCLINATIGLKKKNYKIKVTNTLKLDLQVWTNFLKHYNGASFINPQYLDKKIIQLFKDSAGVENGLFWW